MQILLEGAEKELFSWLDFSNEQLGAAIRACAVMTAEGKKDISRLMFANGCALALVTLAHTVNSQESSIILNGVSKDSGEFMGHYRVTVEKSDSPFETDEAGETWEDGKLTQVVFKTTEREEKEL